VAKHDSVIMGLMMMARVVIVNESGALVGVILRSRASRGVSKHGCKKSSSFEVRKGYFLPVVALTRHDDDFTKRQFCEKKAGLKRARLKVLAT
jgi:hypothetical protein